jgi:hypothetical protein
MVEIGVGPAGFLVAGFAFVAERALMRIVFHVAGRATRRQLFGV